MELIALVWGAEGTPRAVAGAMGGVTRWLYVILVDKKMAISQGVSTVILGAILGYYASPNFVGAAEAMLDFGHLSTNPDRMPTFTAFLTGVTGIGVVGLVIDLLGAWRKKLIPEPPVDLSSKPSGDGP
jgi:hypothetical protein